MRCFIPGRSQSWYGSVDNVSQSDPGAISLPYERFVAHESRDRIGSKICSPTCCDRSFAALDFLRHALSVTANAYKQQRSTIDRPAVSNHTIVSTHNFVFDVQEVFDMGDIPPVIGDKLWPLSRFLGYADRRLLLSMLCG